MSAVRKLVACYSFHEKTPDCPEHFLIAFVAGRYIEALLRLMPSLKSMIAS